MTIHTDAGVRGLAPMLWLDATPYARTMRAIAAEGPGSPTLRAYLDGVGEPMRKDDLLHHALQKVAVHELAILEDRGAFRPTPEMVGQAIVTSKVVMFHMHGRQVFHLDDALAEELAQTDVDDVSPGEVRVPHVAFYLTLGGDAARDAGLGDVQGILVTTEEATPGYLSMTAMRMEDGRAVALDSGHIDLSVGDDVADSLDHALADVTEADPDVLPGDGDTDAAINEGYRLHALDQIAGMERLRRGIRLLVNAMLYIDAPGAGRRRGWHPETPADMAAKADGAVGAAKAEQKLARQGWTRVVVMTLEDGASAQERGTGSVRRTHWRRGHWRRQRYGPGNVHVKRIRIRPIRVVGRAEGDVEGHEYVLGTVHE